MTYTTKDVRIGASEALEVKIGRYRFDAHYRLHTKDWVVVANTPGGVAFEEHTDLTVAVVELANRYEDEINR